MILYCGCKFGVGGNTLGVTFQDARYGVGNRAHTPTKVPKDDQPKYRCTICRIERGKPGPVESAKSKKAREKAEKEEAPQKNPREKLAKAKK